MKRDKSERTENGTKEINRKECDKMIVINEQRKTGKVGRLCKNGKAMKRKMKKTRI